MKKLFILLTFFIFLGAGVYFYLRSISQPSDINIITTRPIIYPSPSPSSKSVRFLGPPVKDTDQNAYTNVPPAR